MKKTASALVAFSFLALSACGSTYDREETIDELSADGTIDRATAECIVDGWEERIGVDRLGDRGDPTTEEEAILTEVITDCLFTSN